jgi:MIP family channel proteins
MALINFDELQPDFGHAQPLFAEALGTAVLVLASAGAGSAFGAVGGLAGGSASLALAPGLSLLALVILFGGVSQAHFNPAVSLGLALAGRLPKGRLVPYMAAQCAGALGAGLVLRVLLRSSVLGTTTSAMPGLAAVMVEALLTFWLVWVYLSVTEKDVPLLHAALALSATLAGAIFWAGHLTGASMNPARSLGPALAAWDFSDLWIYLVGPCLGAAGAALGYRWFKKLG